MHSGHFIKENVKDTALVPALLSSIHQGIALMDGDLNLLVFSRRAKDLLDLPEALFESDPNLADLIRYFAQRGDYGPGDVEGFVSSITGAARRDEIAAFDRALPDGRMLKVQVTPLPDGGQVTVYSDITDYRAVETRLEENQSRLVETLRSRSRELEESRDLLSSAVDAIPDALVMIDSEGRLTLANSNMKSLFPLIDVHLDQRSHLKEAFPFEWSEAQDLREFLSEVSGQSDRRMFGRWFRIQVSSIATGGYVVVFSDISDLKEQHKKLRAHADQLVKHLRKEKRLNEMQRQFVSMASHEFRTPLAIIDGAAQRLHRRFEQLDPDAVRERLDNMREAVRRINYLIERFIDFAVSQDGALEIVPQPNALLPVVRTVCEQQQQGNKTHQVVLSESVGDLLVNFDRRMIEQCLMNVIGNAIKYSPGKDKVLVDLHRENNSVCIDVTDFGVGIPKNEIKKVFGRFYRASTSSGIPGTGIGLNLTEMIVVRHKGRMSVTSEVGKGSTVTLRLPLHQSEVPSAPAGAGQGGTEQADDRPAVEAEREEAPPAPPLGLAG
ncbi:phospho-acceptor domain-containing protein [Breoghania corrubedonensis]|uniref:histidine kinase n=1 Tax=Breoghania corrubedonensis TaxID=665038 RepID=A0A2T5VCM3_9HYPH|nr:PAS-domain containing protein [Breoghania corrubedonensis]PTW61498.1 phospho-acceptor domain-containing protein [Breoghania corrubedonensis]